MDPTIARMEQDLKDLDRSIHTRTVYVQTVKRFQRHFGRPLQELGVDEVTSYMRMLVRSPDHSASTCAVYAAALRFVFRVTMQRPEQVAGLRTPRRARKLPTVLTAEQVRRCLAVTSSERNRALVMLAYGAGLRIAEATHLQIADIDSANGVIRVRQGKGRKERLVMLSPVLLEQLRRAYREQRPEGAWLFPGAEAQMPITPRRVRRIWADIQLRAGLRRHYPFHALRGAFATDLLDGGVDLRTIGLLLGHARMSSTVRYLAVQPSHVAKVVSPLDRLLDRPAVS